MHDRNRSPSSLRRLLCTVAALTSSALPALAFAEVKAGFASFDVSTDASVTLGGYGVHIGNPNGTRKSNGIHDPLLASAVAFEGDDGRGVIVVSLDSVGLSAETARRVREVVYTQVPKSKVFLVLSASHSHGTPDTMGLWGALPFFTGRDAAYMETFEATAARAAVSAWKARVPATFRYGATRYANSSTSKPTAAERNDQVVSIIARDSRGAVLGTFTQWSAHPTVLPEKNFALSSDYIGAFRAFMTKRWTGTHVFVNGVIGGVYPAKTPRRVADPFLGGDKDPGLADRFDEAAAIGSELAAATSSALEASVPLQGKTFAGEARSFEFKMANKLFQWASGLKLIETKPGPGGIAKSEVSLVRLGSLTAVGLPGELFPSAAAEIEAQLATMPNGGRLPGVAGSHPLFFGIANDWLGYVMSARDLADPDLSYNKTLSPGGDCLPKMSAAVASLVQTMSP